MKYFKYLLAGLIVFPCLTSCNDADFLKEDPETFYTIDNVFSTSEQINQVVTTCYQKVRNIYCPYNNAS